MTTLFTIGVGDTGPALVENLKKSDGSALNLTGSSNLTFHLYDDAGVAVASGAGTVLDAAGGQVQWTWTTPAPAAEGTYLRRWTVTLSDGSHVSIPNDVDGYPVLVTDPTVTAATGRLTCAAWCTPLDVAKCGPCSGSSFDTDVLDDAIQTASDILFFLSGKQFTGVCPDVVRPMRDNSGWYYSGILPIGQIEVNLGSYNRSSFYRTRDYIYDRRNVPSEVLLPAYPVNAITQVLVDGQVVPPSAYRIADDRWLMRVDGSSWPCSQDLAQPTTALGTFQVSYTYGVPIPPAGVRAAAAYACQVVQACSTDGSDCTLPPRTRQVVRQGVTMTTNTSDDFIDNGKTGVPAADAFIKAVNPKGYSSRAAVFSPDVDWPAHRLR